MNMDVCSFLKKKTLLSFPYSSIISSDTNKLGFSLSVAITFLPGHMELHLSFRYVTGFLSRIIFLDTTSISLDYILNCPFIYCQLNLPISL